MGKVKELMVLKTCSFQILTLNWRHSTTFCSANYFLLTVITWRFEIVFSQNSIWFNPGNSLRLRAHPPNDSDREDDLHPLRCHWYSFHVDLPLCSGSEASGPNFQTPVILHQEVATHGYIPGLKQYTPGDKYLVVQPMRSGLFC